MATYKLSESDNLLEAMQAGANVPAGLADFRRVARQRFSALGLPTLKQEEWRFLSVKPVADTHFSLPGPDSDASTLLEYAEASGLSGLTSHLAVIVDGVFRPELSQLGDVPSVVVVQSIASSSENPVFLQYFGRVAVDSEHPFMALNSAGFNDGLFIHIPRNTVVEDPIHLLYITTDGGDATISNPRILVVSEESSQATILESFIGPDSVSYLVNPVSEFVVKENAGLDHYRLQFDGKDAFHFATLDARQERSSRFSTQTFTFGGRITRNDTGLHMDGDGGHGTMNGLYQLSDSQVVDNHTRIDHAYPNCETHELFKGILDDHSRGVFNGRIMVRQIAQKTDSKQTNRTLLLSSDALINTNPQLEIFADDVKCTHGATIGQIEETQLYYLRSRGISEEESRRILVFAFANDVVEKVTYEPLRNLLEHKLLAAQEVKTALAKA